MSVALLGYVLCPHAARGEEIAIEDRIGDPASTDGNEGLFSEVPTGLVTISKVFSESSVRLTKIEIVGAPARYDPELKREVSTPPFHAIQNMKIAIHSTEEHARLQPLAGDFVYSLGWGAGGATGLEEPILRYIPLDVADSYGIQSYLFSMDLRLDMFPEVRLNGGTSYWVTLTSEVNFGDIYFPESELPGESDVLMGQSGDGWAVVCSWASCFDLPFNTGRMPFKLIGETLGPPGDYDRDGDVDGADYLQWQQEFGSAKLAYKGADGNGNGVVDAADYTVWRDNLGATSGTGSQAAVPEPGSLVLLMLSLGVFCVRKRFTCR